MPVSVIVGGQFGSEGKGKVAHWLCRNENAAAAVRVGGPNSGHTVISDDGTRFVFRQLPTAAILPDVLCVLPAGSYLDANLTIAEIRFAGVNPDRLLIDPKACIIDADDIAREASLDLKARIASTGVGVGGCVMRHIERRRGGPFAQDDERLKPYVADTAERLRGLVSRGRRVVIEGTQGFGLSLLHGSNYPHVTSRDTTAASALSEAGLSPIDVDDVVLVFRAFPIRVGGPSGPLPNEVDWDTVTAESESDVPLVELTTVTRTVRRIGRFDPQLARRAIAINAPTRIALNHLDYVDAKCRRGILTERAGHFVSGVEASIGRRIDMLGFSQDSLIEAQASTGQRSLQNA